MLLRLRIFLHRFLTRRLGLVFICTGENSVGADCLKAALEAMQQHLGDSSEQTKACKEFLDIAQEASGKEAVEEDAEA
jgi:hypothetical protein